MLIDLFTEKRRIKTRASSQENIARLNDIENIINDILFVPEIVSLLVKDKKDYTKIIQNGFYINGIKFVRLLCGSGHSRRNTVIFCADYIEKDLKEILDNGRNKDCPISENKFNAYFALSFSGTQIVNDCYFTVVPDYEITRTETVDFVVQDQGEEFIEQRDMELTFNCFDGMGLVSVRKAKEWSEELGLDYIPSTFILRNSFMKGMVCTFDFQEYIEDQGIHLTHDIYGNSVNLRDMDLILTKSMFKGSSFYSSLQEYKDSCKKNDMKWGISRFSPKKDSDYVFSNYQFVQNLNLNDEKIEKLCKKTLDYFYKTMGGGIDYALLYLLGDSARQGVKHDLLKRIGDPTTKSLILNNQLIRDPYIKNHIINSLNKKIKESYIGNLILDGNYSTMISDPVALMQHVLGLPVVGLLNRNEHYSQYWVKRNVEKVVAMRAPLTWRSEVNILNMKSNKDTNYWYRYITSGVIYNIHGVDTMLAADSDFDGDLVMTSNDPVMLDSVYGGIPITYEKGGAVKKKIVDSELWKVDQKAFDSTIGLITNYSTTMDSIIQKFDKDTVEYNELIKRLKLCRFYQGQAIDAAKNDNYKKMPSYWSAWTKIREDMDENKKAVAELRNKLIVDKRPIFMRHIYSSLNREYLKYVKKYERGATMMFGKSFTEIRNCYENCNKAGLSSEEIDFVEKYYRFSPVIETGSISNKICFYLEKKIKEIKATNKDNTYNDHILILQDADIPFDNEKLKKLYDLYKRYKSEKRNFMSLVDDNGDEMCKTIDQYNKLIRNEAYKISSDICELANLAVNICYVAHPSDNKQFVWQIFGDGIVQNVFKNRQDKVLAPFYDQNGKFEYLGSRFSMFELNVEEPESWEEDYENLI